MHWTLKLLRRVALGKHRRVIGWCATCKYNVYADEPSYAVDGDLRVHEGCDYRERS